MKKTVLGFVLLLSVAVLFSSCTSNYNFVFDKENPPEKNSKITFENDTTDGYFYLKEWNGIDITDTLYGNNRISSGDSVHITIPSGNNTFTFDVKYTFTSRYSSRTYEFKNFELRYTFEAGKEYEIKGDYKTLALGFMGIEFYVRLYDTTGRSKLLKEWMIGKS